MRPPVLIKWHQDEGFAQDMPDDAWISIVCPRKWVVLSQDSKFHLLENETLAIKQHGIRCFIFQPPAKIAGHRYVILYGVTKRCRSWQGASRRPSFTK